MRRDLRIVPHFFCACHGKNFEGWALGAQHCWPSQDHGCGFGRAVGLIFLEWLVADYGDFCGRHFQAHKAVVGVEV